MAHFASKAVVYVTADAASMDKPPEGVEYIAVRAALSLGQRTEMQASLVEVDTKSGAASPRMDRYLRTFNEMAIAGWYLLDGDGQPVPFTREAIGDLDPGDPLVDRAMKEFAERNPMSPQKPVSSGSTS